MSAVRCPECRTLQRLVPYITVEEVGVVPQYIGPHRVGGRHFVGPQCPGAGRVVPVVAEQRRQP